MTAPPHVMVPLPGELTPVVAPLDHEPPPTETDPLLGDDPHAAFELDVPREGVVLVTGAAGGIGTATCAAFLDAGWNVLALDRDDAVRTLPSLLAAPERCVPALADVCDLDSMVSALSVLPELGPLRHVVAIVGGALAGEMHARDPGELDLDTFCAAVELNLTSAWITVQAALPYLRSSTGDRSLTLTTSRNAFAAYGLAAYSAAKGGVCSLVPVLAQQLGELGIRVNAVAPGQVETPGELLRHAHDPLFFQRAARRTALRRLATVDECARTYRALALELTGISGQVIVVDAGGDVCRRE